MWSDEIDVSLAGLDEELVTINPARLRHQQAPDVTALAKAMRRAREATEATGLDVLAGRVEGRGVDSWTPTILINGSASAPQQFRGDVERLLEDLAGGPGRIPIALVALEAGHAASSGATISLDFDRRFTLQPWGVPLVANRLTTEDARTLAALLDDRDTADQPMPATSGPQPSDHPSDKAGALRVELTEPRIEAGTSGSLLPLPDATYIASAATTTADLAALSPSVLARTRESVLAVDPSLDDDVADWYAPGTHRPRLRLLGPIELWASGERTSDVDRRLAYFTEIVAYLASRVHGATPEQVAAAFDVKTNTIHSRVGTVRKWLGLDPTTGDWYSARIHALPIGEISWSPGVRGAEAVERRRSVPTSPSAWPGTRIRGDP